MKRDSVCICAVLLALLGTAPAFSTSMRASLNPEERALYMQQMHGANWRSLSLQQRCARMAQMRAEWRSMNSTARNQLKQQLSARWQTLPAAQKQDIDQRIAAHQARRAQNTGRRGEPRCAGLKPGSAP
jgi:hypothetical protein